MDELTQALAEYNKSEDNLTSAVFNFVLRNTDVGKKKIQLDFELNDNVTINELYICDYFNLFVSVTFDYAEQSERLFKDCSSNMRKTIVQQLIDGNYKVVDFNDSDFDINNK